MKHEFDSGKYTVTFDENTGKMEALRYGEPWRDVGGDALIYLMLAEVDDLKKQRAELLEALKVAKKGLDLAASEKTNRFLAYVLAGDKAAFAIRNAEMCK